MTATNVAAEPHRDPGARAGGERRRAVLPILMVAAVALAMIVSAWPRLIAGVAEAPFQDTLAPAPNAAPPAEAAIRRAAAAKEKAASIYDNGRTWADVGLFRLREAIALGIASLEGRAALDASIAAHRRALAVEPSQAFVLTRLAQGILMRDGADDPLIPVLLAAAIDAAPYDSTLVVPRIGIALAAWDFLQPELRESVQRQIHIAADLAPAELAAAAARGFAFQRIVVMLGDDPALLKRFAFAYSRL